MILKTLSLKNFKQYNELELDFQEGLVGIVGKNGSGKSSIFEGILLCLFGSNNTDKEFYKSSWAGPKDPVELQLSFELNQKHYQIIRSFRGKVMTHKAELFDHQDQQIATGANTVNQQVTELLGMDKEAFTRSVFSGQKELGIISGTTGEERKKMVRKMVGLDQLDHIQKIIREDRNHVRKHIQFQVEALIDTEAIKGIQEEVKSTKKDLTKVKKELEQKSKKLEKAIQVYQKAKTIFDDQLHKQQAFQVIQTKLAKYQEHVLNFEEREQSLKEEIKELEQLQTQLKAKAPEIKEYEKQEKKKAQLEKDKAKFDELKNLEAQQERFQTGLTSIKEQISTLEKSIKTLPQKQKELEVQTQHLSKSQTLSKAWSEEQLQLQNDLGAIEGRIKERAQNIQQIQTVGKDADCPTCFRPLAEVYDSTIKNLEKEIQQYETAEKKKIETSLAVLEKKIFSESEKQEKTQKEITTLSSEIDRLEEDQKELKEQQERLINGEKHLQETAKTIKALGKINFDQAVFDQLSEAIENGKEQYIEYRTQLNRVTEIKNKKVEAKELKERIVNGQKVIKEQQSAIKKIKYSEEQFHQTRADQGEKETAKNELQGEVEEQKRLLLITQNSLEKLEQQITQHEKALDAIKEKKESQQELDELDGLFSAFKTYILEKVRPTISNEASQLFERITNGRYEGIEVDDNFEFHIFENGNSYPITRFSGGEVDLANLCLRIGISKAISELSGRGTSLGFLGFDEVFGSQDEDRRFGILHALEHLREKYRQIYIISHVNSVKEHFPAILQIHKTHQGSTAYWQ